MTRAASPADHRPGYLTGSGLVADIGPLLPTQGCRLPSPDRGMRYDARTSSPNRKRRPEVGGETERMWDQLICPPRQEMYGPPPSPAGWGDRSPGRILFDDVPGPEVEAEERYRRSCCF